MFRKASGDRAVIEPSLIKLKYRSVAESIILIFHPMHLETYLKINGYDANKFRSFNVYRYYKPPKKGMPGIAGPAIGAPAATSLIETLIALGAKKILGFGACGSLQTDFETGQLLVPVQGHSEEGASRHYYPEKRIFETSSSLRATLEGFLLDQEISYRFGDIWTTDAFFRETADKVTHYQNQGVMGVDMENSAMCAVADFRDAQYAALLVVSDELGTLRWKPGFMLPKFKRALKSIMAALGSFRF